LMSIISYPVEASTRKKGLKRSEDADLINTESFVSR
jgi:hypothetical protein